MSTDNAARYYWGKFDKAIAIFEAGNLEGASEIVLELGNEFRCPRSVRSNLLAVLNRQACAIVRVSTLFDCPTMVFESAHVS
jgi:hypothetical protein